MNAGGLAAGDSKTGDGALHYDNEPSGPGPSVENPAGVYPHALPEAGTQAHQNRTDQAMVTGAQGEQAEAIPQATGGVPGTGAPVDTKNDPRVVFSNPMLFSELMIKLSSALTDTINAIDQESGSGVGDVGRQLQNKFRAWRDEVDGVSPEYPEAAILADPLWQMRKGEPVDAPNGQGNVQRNTGSDGCLYSD